VAPLAVYLASDQEGGEAAAVGREPGAVSMAGILAGRSGSEPSRGEVVGCPHQRVDDARLRDRVSRIADQLEP